MPGTPATSERGGTSMPSVTSAPAAIIDSSPMTAPFMTIAPMPTSTWSPIVAPCTTAPWPTDTPSPRLTGRSTSTWNAQLSWTLDRAPMVIGSLSARSTAPYQMLAPASIVTDPTMRGRGCDPRLVVDLGRLSVDRDLHAANASCQVIQRVIGSMAKYTTNRAATTQSSACTSAALPRTVLSNA